MISLFGWLDSIPGFAGLSYKFKGAAIRAIKVGLSGAIGFLLASATDGSIFPVGASPYIIVVVTMGLTSIDKFIREWNIEKDLTDHAVPITIHQEPAVPIPGPIEHLDDVVSDAVDPVGPDGVLLDGENPTVFDDPK